MVELVPARADVAAPLRAENVGAAAPEAPPDTMDWLRSRFLEPNQSLADEFGITFDA